MFTDLIITICESLVFWSVLHWLASPGFKHHSWNSSSPRHLLTRLYLVVSEAVRRTGYQRS